MRAYGKVRAKISTKGLGLILPFPSLNPTEEVFFHAKSMEEGEYDLLKTGELVELDLDPEGPKGPRALSVTRVLDEPTVTKLLTWENEK